VQPLSDFDRIKQALLDREEQVMGVEEEDQMGASPGFTFDFDSQ